MLKKTFSFGSNRLPHQNEDAQELRVTPNNSRTMPPINDDDEVAWNRHQARPTIHTSLLHQLGRPKWYQRGYTRIAIGITLILAVTAVATVAVLVPPVGAAMFIGGLATAVTAGVLGVSFAGVGTYLTVTGIKKERVACAERRQLKELFHEQHINNGFNSAVLPWTEPTEVRTFSGRVARVPFFLTPAKNQPSVPGSSPIPWQEPSLEDLLNYNNPTLLQRVSRFFRSKPEPQNNPPRRKEPMYTGL